MRAAVRWGVPVFVIAAGAAGLVSAEDVPSTRRKYPTVEEVESRRAGEPVPASSIVGGAATAGLVTGPQLVYQGAIDGIGVTTGHPQVYVVFWGSQWGTATPPGSTSFSNDPAGVAPRVEALLQGIGTNDELWSGVMTQYCEGVPAGTQTCPVDAPHVGYPTGGALAGIWNDIVAPAPADASGPQIAAEAIAAAAHFGNTTPASNRSAQYVVVSPTGTHPDGFNAGGGFCAWHDYVGAPTSPYGDIAYTNLPYIPDAGPSCGSNFVNAGAAGALDGVTMVEGHEYAETITDQNPAGGWIDQGRQENADKCTWIRSGPGRSQNVAFATGTFAMQTTWSNDGRACLVSHAIWGVPGLPDDFGFDLEPRSGFAVPGDAAVTELTSVTATGNPQTIDLSASDLPPDSTVSFAPATMSSDGTSTLTVQTSSTTPNGQYPITITATGASATHSLTFVVVVGPVPPPLQNGVAVTGISGIAGSDQYWQIDIPPGFHTTDFTLAGGTGDADMYLQEDLLPTDSDFLCGSVSPGNLETCLGFDLVGRWFVRVHGSADFTGAALRVTSTNPGRMISGQIMYDVSGTAGSQTYYWVRVLPAVPARLLKFSITHLTGDADLYGRYFSFPSPFVGVCKPPRPGRHGESCTIRTPSPGIWYFGVYGVTDYSGVKVKAKVRY